jgi:hypothetical protein
LRFFSKNSSEEKWELERKWNLVCFGERVARAFQNGNVKYILCLVFV